MHRGLIAACAATVLLAGLACGSPDNAASPAQPVEQAAAEDVRKPAAAPVARPRARVVALGDSLTAGLGIRVEEAYPALLQQRMDEAGFDYEVVNAGVSGDTSAGGLRRLDWALEGEVRVLIVALGGNDALRGLPVEQLRHNLSQIIETARARNITVVLAGMEAPPNFGSSYTVSFHQVYVDLVKEHQVALVPFLLDRVAGVESLNQRDGIHPTADGARIVADNVWAALKPVLEAQKAVR